MTTEVFMRDVWRGPAEEADACQRCLKSLGPDSNPEAGRLRFLLAKIIRAFRSRTGAPWPTWPYLISRQDPATPQRIAAVTGWPQDLISADLDKLAQAGLLGYDSE